LHGLFWRFDERIITFNVNGESRRLFKMGDGYLERPDELLLLGREERAFRRLTPLCCV